VRQGSKHLASLSNQSPEINRRLGPEEAGPGRLTMNAVTMIYDPEQWDFETEELSPERLGREGERFYRLLLHLKIPKPDIQCEIRFEIAGYPME
jgi:hypothetical protein